VHAPGFELNQIVALGVAVVASGFDVRTRRIPNSLTFGAAVGAFAHGAWTHGVSGLGISVASWLTASAIFLPFFALGGMGGGDVKLVGGIAAWLTPADALWTALYAMIAGGAMGIIIALASGYFRKMMMNLRLLLMHWRVAGIRPLPELTLSGGRGLRLPYAVPIAFGTLAAIWLR
jgi:prepilin peptidase CpaA